MLVVAVAFERAHVLVDEVRDDEGVDGGDGGRFGRREDAAIDAAQDDHDQQQAPAGVKETGDGDLPKPGPGLGRQVLDLGGDVDADHQHQAGEQAGDDAGQKHAADRDVDGGGVDHHDDRGRDQNAERAGIADDAGGEFLGVADLAHAGDHDGADGDHGRRRRAGQGGEQHAGEDAGDREPALKMTDAGDGEADDALGDAARST